MFSGYNNDIKYILFSISCRIGMINLTLLLKDRLDRMLCDPMSHNHEQMSKLK